MRCLVTFDKEQQQSQHQTTNNSNTEDFKNISITELIEEKVLPIALKCDIDIWKFYEYTLKEIQLLIEAYQDKEKDNLRIQAQMDYVSNMSLANFIGCLFSKDAKPTSFEETYSFLYDQEELDEIEQAKQEAERQRQLEIQRAWYKSFAESFNAKFENNTGENEDN